MKTIIKIFVALLSIYFISCSEDLHLHDGLNGKDGQDGKDGHSLVTKVESLYSLQDTSKIIGTITKYYIDLDDDLTYSEGDKYDNSVTTFNGEAGLNATINQTLLSPSEQYPQGAVLVETYTGGIITSSIIYSLPKDGQNGDKGDKGDKGDTGSNGHSLIPSISEIKVDGLITGHMISLYLDLDDDGLISSEDVLKGGFPVLNGESPKISYSIVDSVFIFSSTVGGTTTTIGSFNLPKNGTNGNNGTNGTNGNNGSNGLTPSLKIILHDNPCGCEGASGTEYIWYLDINKNSEIDPGEESYPSVICNGLNGSSSKSLLSMTLAYDFAGYSTIENIIANGFDFCNAGLSEGLVFLKGTGSMTTPTFEDSSDLYYMTFRYGSCQSRKVNIIAMMNDSTEKVLDEFQFEGMKNFLINSYYTYNLYTYHANLDDVEFKDISRIRVESVIKTKCSPDDFFIRDLRIVLIKK